MAHPDDERLMIPVPVDGLAPARVATACSSKARSTTTTASRSRPRPHRSRSTSTATSLPAGGPTCRGAVTTRSASRRSMPSSGRSSPVPTSVATTPIHTPGGLLLRPSSMGADSTLPPGDVWVWKQLAERGTALTGYTVALGVRRLHVGSVEDDERRRRRLGLRTSRHLRLDHGVLGRRPGRDRPQAVDSTSGTSARPTTRRSRCCGGATSTIRLATSTGIRSTIRSSARSSSVAGTSSVSGTTRRRTCSAPRSPRTPSSPCTRRCAHRDSRSVTRRWHRLGADRWRVEVGLANSGWLATDVSKRARKEKLVKPIVVELTGDGVDGARQAGTT